MNTHARWHHIIQRLLITGTLLLATTGLALHAAPEESKEALVFRSPDGTVSMATVNGDNIEVKQLSDVGQEVEYISTARFGKSVWVVYPKKNEDIQEGWKKYGQLNVYIVRGDLRHIPKNNPYAITLSLSGEWLIYLVDTDGGAKHILCSRNLSNGFTKTITKEWQYIQVPTLSSNGIQAAYFGAAEAGSYRLHIANVYFDRDTEKSPSTPLINNTDNSIAKIIWSPDSRHIYFTSRNTDTGSEAAISSYEVSAEESNTIRRLATGQCYSISPDGNIVNIAGKGYRIDTPDVTPVPLPDSMTNASLLSPSGRVTAYIKTSNEVSAVNDNSLWCRKLDTGREVKVSDARWDGSHHDWQQQWTVMMPPSAEPSPHTGTMPGIAVIPGGMPGMPGMPGTPPPGFVQQSPPPTVAAATGPRCDKLVLLAAEMNRGGRKIDSLTQDEKNTLPDGWQSGLPLAMNFMKKGVSEVIPFTVWVMNIKMDPNAYHFSEQINIDEMRMACYGLKQSVGNSKAGVLCLAAMLTAPQSTDLSDIQLLKADIQYVDENDREALFTLFSKQKMSTKTLYFTIMSTLEIPWVQPWVRNLAETQDDCSFGVIITLSRCIQVGDPVQIRKQLKRLSRTSGWEYTSYYVDSYSTQLMQKGMRKEAIQLLEIISDKGIGYPKINAGIELSKLTGKPPKQPVGLDADNTSNWLYYARMNQGLGRKADAQAALLKVLKSSGIPYEKAEALKLLAISYPEKAFDLIPGLLPDFLKIDSNDSYLQSTFNDVGDALCNIAKIRRSLASRVAPFIEQLSKHDINSKPSLAKDRALINLWAGNTDEGIKDLSEGYSNSMQVFFAVIIYNDLSDDIRSRVLKELKNYLSSKNPEPKSVEQAIQYTNELNIDIDRRMKTGQWISVHGDKLSPEGMKSLAATLWRYVSTSPDPTPEALKLHALAGLPFPESLRKAGKSPIDNIKPYPKAIQKSDPVKGSDPSGIYTIYTYAASTDIRKVYDYYQKTLKKQGGSSMQEGKLLYADFTAAPFVYRVLIHIEPKGVNKTEFTIKVYGEQ